MSNASALSQGQQSLHRVVDDEDPLGQALMSYWQNGAAEPIKVLCEGFSPDEIEVSYFFRNLQNMPVLEKKALDGCYGKVLDIGAGAGSHALVLQSRGHCVTTVDHSPGAVKVQRARGVQQPFCLDIMDQSHDQQLQTHSFDTILLLMNGIGVTASLQGMSDFLKRMKQWLSPQGQILFDSSDLCYLYDEVPIMRTEDGSDYYGQLHYQMVYQGAIGKPFSWLFADFQTLERLVKPLGFDVSKLFQGEHHEYLARLTLNAKEH